MTKKEIATIEKQMQPATIETLADALIVTDEKSEQAGAELLSKFNLAADWVQNDKAKEYDPAWATVVAIRARWKPQEDALQKGIKTVRAKLNAYRTAAKAAADAAAAKIADRVGEGKGKLKIDTAARQIEDIEKPAAVVNTGMGSVKYRTMPKFKVVSLKDLPLEYHLADEVRIRKMMVAGMKLPGVEYWDEEVPQNYR